MNFKSVDDVLDFAIKGEQDAARFYKDLAAKLENPGLTDMFESFAEEENMHEAKLREVKGNLMMTEEIKVKDLKISDYSVNVKIEAAMNYQDALLLAMKKEKASFKLYTILSQIAKDPEVKKLLKALAVEESNHKLRFEIEYDEHVLLEN